MKSLTKFVTTGISIITDRMANDMYYTAHVVNAVTDIMKDVREAITCNEVVEELKRSVLMVKVATQEADEAMKAFEAEKKAWANIGKKPKKQRKSTKRNVRKQAEVV